MSLVANLIHTAIVWQYKIWRCFKCALYFVFILKSRFAVLFLKGWRGLCN